MIPIGKTTPSIIFPEGAVIEDPRMIAQILHKYPKSQVGHTYKVKVLEWKIPVPPPVQQLMDNPDEIVILVVEENISNIKRIS